MKQIKIAISGKSGCGNTTISGSVAKALGLRCVNFTFRSLAEKHEKSVEEILALAAKDDSWDKTVDQRQVALAMEEGGCVLGSRLAIWLLEKADLKVYLRVKSSTRAARITFREGGNIEEVAAFTEERDRQDRERFLKLYNIDNDDFSFADLIIDTDEKMIEEVVGIICAKVKELSAH
jgi:cytidylate kinase